MGNMKVMRWYSNLTIQNGNSALSSGGGISTWYSINTNLTNVAFNSNYSIYDNVVIVVKPKSLAGITEPAATTCVMSQ